MSVDKVAPFYHHVAQSVVFCVVDWNASTGVDQQHGKDLLAYLECAKQFKCVHEGVVVGDAMLKGVM